MPLTDETVTPASDGLLEALRSSIAEAETVDAGNMLYHLNQHAWLGQFMPAVLARLSIAEGSESGGREAGDG